jgi:uncharacterized protein (TIGR03382 family)
MRSTARRAQRALFGTISACFFLGAGCMADSAVDLDEPVEPSSIEQPVVGGEPVTDCQWPSTVRVDPAQCTGTLIHPRVVTTAAHCLTGAMQTIGFGSRGAPGSFSVQARCVGGARGSSGGNTGRDWAYCVLPEDPRIAKMQVTPPLVGCEAELMKPGSMAWVVGFGSTTARGRVGVKRHVEVKINQYNKLAPGTIDIGDRYAGACHGDSGGPLYFRVVRDGVDYGLRTAGSTSGAGGACDCTCSTTYVNIENHVKAIEKNEGIDVTPCTDAEGKWDPSPACTAFESGPERGTGTFPDCTVARTSAPIASCGPATTGAGDAGAEPGGANDGDAGVDAGVPPTTTRPDAGARQDAGRSGASDAAAPPDAASSAGPTPRDAAAARRDGGTAPSGSSARDGSTRRDAQSADDDESADDESDRADDSADNEDETQYRADSGCSAAPTNPSSGSALALLALAFGHARRRRRAPPSTSRT